MNYAFEFLDTADPVRQPLERKQGTLRVLDRDGGRPEQVGQRVRIVLLIGKYRIPLIGVVAWSRRRSRRGLPLGMGVELDSPPAVYLQLVASLRQAEPDQVG